MPSRGERLTLPPSVGAASAAKVSSTLIGDENWMPMLVVEVHRQLCARLALQIEPSHHPRGREVLGQAKSGKVGPLDQHRAVDQRVTGPASPVGRGFGRGLNGGGFPLAADPVAGCHFESKHGVLTMAAA
jgi:hypothetical protein